MRTQNTGNCADLDSNLYAGSEMGMFSDKHRASIESDLLYGQTSQSQVID